MQRALRVQSVVAVQSLADLRGYGLLFSERKMDEWHNSMPSCQLQEPLPVTGPFEQQAYVFLWRKAQSSLDAGKQKTALIERHGADLYAASTYWIRPFSASLCRRSSRSCSRTAGSTRYSSSNIRWTSSGVCPAASSAQMRLATGVNPKNKPLSIFSRMVAFSSDWERTPSGTLIFAVASIKL